MENGPFPDVFPIENWDIPLTYIDMLVYQRVSTTYSPKICWVGRFLVVFFFSQVIKVAIFLTVVEVTLKGRFEVTFF